MSNYTEQLQRMKTDPGFVAALDQSGGSTPKALSSYGIKENGWSNDLEMFALVHQMRTRIITSPSFTSGRILAAILFEQTMESAIEGQPSADYFVECETGCAFSKSGPGPCSREGRRSVDEADAQSFCAARQGRSEAHIWNQNALVYQTGQHSEHQGNCQPAVRNGSADHYRGSCADHRAGSRHSLPGKSQG